MVFFISLDLQDFSHDGQAPDVFFWADGVIVPYITRYTLLVFLFVCLFVICIVLPLR